MKILIVDDDVFVHTNLKNMINWEAEGFLLCGAAASGAEAIRLIEAESPEIVITDMNMPGVNGVALIKHLNRHFPAIRVIALSAYDDFEYVKESLKMGAVDYILKHTLTPPDLLGLLQSVRKTMLQERRRERNREEQLQTGKSVLRQMFIQELVREGFKDRTEVQRKIQALELKIGFRNLVVVAGELDDYGLLREKFTGGEINNLMKSIVDMTAEILKDTEKALISPLEGEKFAILFSFGEIRSTQSIFNRVLAALARIKTTIKRYLNITACFGFDEICPDITQVKEYYAKAERQLARKFYQGKDRIYHDPSINAARPHGQLLEIQDEKNLLELIKSREGVKLQRYLEEIFARIERHQPDPGAIRMTFIHLINIANKAVRDSGCDPAFIFGETDNPYAPLEKLETIREVREWLLGIFVKLINGLERLCLNSEYNEVTKRAVEYIYKNYNRDIALGDIADFTGVNHSYLSRKFKKDCGKGVVEFLNAFRIEQAKTLMEQGGLKVKEIAGKVGFSNYNYFFKVFRDSEGMTPLEYERSCPERAADPG